VEPSLNAADPCESSGDIQQIINDLKMHRLKAKLRESEDLADENPF